MQDMGSGIGQHARPVVVQTPEATPPPTASDAAYQPEYDLRGTIAGKAESFTAHGVSRNTLGSFPGGARASQILPDLTGPQFVNPARAGDGYQLQGAGTPELMRGQPKQGAVLDKLDALGYLHLGVGPAIPILLLVIIGAVALWSTRK